MSPLKSGVKWPVYEPRDRVSARSQQVWIRHRLLGGMVHVPRDTSRCTPTSKPTPGAGVAPSWIGTAHCGSGSSPGSSRGGLRSRCPGAWLWIQASGSSPTRPSTGSYTPNWWTTPGATTCLAGSPGVVAGEETPLHSSTSELQNVPRELMTGRHRHWEADPDALPHTAKPSSPSTNATTAHRSQTTGKASDPIALAMARVLAPLPPGVASDRHPS